MDFAVSFSKYSHEAFNQRYQYVMRLNREQNKKKLSGGSPVSSVLSSKKAKTVRKGVKSEKENSSGVFCLQKQG